MSGVSIRRARDENRAAIAAIHAASWQEAYRGVLPDAFLNHEIEGAIFERWTGLGICARDMVLVAERDGIIGFCATWNGEPPYIDNLHVRSGQRSAGIGQALLGDTARRLLAQGDPSAALHVVVSNHRARRLYAALGGRPGGFEDKKLLGHPAAHEKIVWDDLTQLVETSTRR